MHGDPKRSRLGVSSVIWESLVSIGGCSREEFADNCFALLYISIEDLFIILCQCKEAPWIGLIFN